ncbi:hypothetical protein DPEC_G00350110 [Dallia pectoralis]|uniref:Uncharacterized protein n=1 Tax=Dallia pectoralis TaxID=75939 RepID=A0ACC2F1N3_DALPE|nr:hypothetical protein DPEC_G00350110 [Dallia pectoralis]
MASSSENVMDSACQIGEDSLNTQLEDLEHRLISLKEQMDLCNTVLKDLVDLRGILKEKNISDESLSAPKSPTRGEKV